VTLEEAIGDIEAAVSLDGLRGTMQRVCESYGFASFSFVDAGRPHEDVPFYFHNAGKAWEDTYKDNGFVHVDPMVARVRRTNIPFTWDGVERPAVRRGPKDNATRLIEAATDFGFKNGLVIPFHYRDRLGRLFSASAVFFWKSAPEEFVRALEGRRGELHLIMIYLIQRCLDLVAVDVRGTAPVIGSKPAPGDPRLSGRERDVLSWAARGKTISETATILGISQLTCESHMKNALAKMGVVNKTHAVAKAIQLGLIDP